MVSLCDAFAHSSQGYLNNPSATRNAITPDGWFKTGDIAIRDSEGYYYIIDRRKELIKYKVRAYLNHSPDDRHVRS
jgi:long-subunit acyl-CoA synthetase (AMP-forming)